MKRAWLELFDWEMVTATNAALCQAKNALHKPTSDGYARTRALWEESHLRLMTLAEMVDLCRECHRLAPFCNYNGNTFAAIARRQDRPIPSIGLTRRTRGAGSASSTFTARLAMWARRLFLNRLVEACEEIFFCELSAVCGDGDDRPLLNHDRRQY